MSYRLYSEQKKMKFSILKKKSVVYRMKCNLLQRYVLQSNLFYHTEIIHIKKFRTIKWPNYAYHVCPYSRRKKSLMSVLRRHM